MLPHTSMHACIHVCMHTYLRTYLSTYLQIYTCIACGDSPDSQEPVGPALTQASQAPVVSHCHCEKTSPGAQPQTFPLRQDWNFLGFLCFTKSGELNLEFKNALQETVNSICCLTCSRGSPKQRSPAARRDCRWWHWNKPSFNWKHGRPGGGGLEKTPYGLLFDDVWRFFHPKKQTRSVFSESFKLPFFFGEVGIHQEVMQLRQQIQQAEVRWLCIFLLHVFFSSRFGRFEIFHFTKQN